MHLPALQPDADGLLQTDAPAVRARRIIQLKLEGQAIPPIA